MQCGTARERLFVGFQCAGLSTRIAAWAAEKRTTGPMLRRALDDVRAGEPKPEWDAFSLKVDFLDMMNELDSDNAWIQQGDDEDRHVKIGGEDELPPNIAGFLYAVRRYLANEPKRSRRVIRLVYANWLAHVEGKTHVIRTRRFGQRLAREAEFDVVVMRQAPMDRPLRGLSRPKSWRAGC